MEPALKKYKVNIETLVNWQKKFKVTKTGSSIHFIKDKQGEKIDSKTTSGKPVMNEKEDELLRLVALLIVQSLLEKVKPDR
jgi:hypothetical protein